MNVDDLCLVAGRFEALASKLSASSVSPETGAGWLATSAAVSQARAEAAAGRAAFASRMRATSQKLAAAGAAYANDDARLGAELCELAGPA